WILARYRNPARLFAITDYRNAPNIFRQRIAPEPFGPLNDDHGPLVGQDFIQVNGMRCRRAPIQPIKIDVIEQQSSRVRINEGEGRAGYLVRIETEGASDAFDQHSLARAQ